MTSPTSGSKIEWYLARDGRQHGPLAESEMMKFLELGHLRPDDLVWRAGFVEWRPASTVFDLSAKATTATAKTQPTATPAVTAPAAPAATSATVNAKAEVKPAASASAVSVDVKAPSSAEVVTDPASAADFGAKTGIGIKRPLDTPLLSPAQLPARTPIAENPATKPELGASDASITDPISHDTPVTSLNERLQRAASERAMGAAGTSPSASQMPGQPAGEPAGPTQPLHKSWPSEPQIAVAPAPGSSSPTAKLQPLPELRVSIPVPLMPLGPRDTAAPQAAAATPTTEPPKAQRKKDPKPELSVAANAEPKSRNRGRSLGVGLTLAIIVGGGGWLAYASRGAITAAVSKSSVASQASTSTTATAPAKPPASPPAAAATPPAAKMASATTPAADTGKASPFMTSAKTADLIDADLKRSPLWQLIASEFPEWHRDRVNEIAKLAAEKRDPAAISRHIAEALVSLRRKFADQALSASPDRLRAVAVAFLENLRQLSAQSTDACYGFISQGETYPAVIDLMRQGDKTEGLHQQSVAVFEAVAFGRKTPQTNLPPRKVDYDTLASELTARGWSQNDLQMFSDAKALAAAPPEQVCKMVQDWFAAQIAIKDPAIQLRLLIESLRPVVAG
jgi:GYF domain 2